MEIRGRIAGAGAVLVLTCALTAGSAASAQAPVAQVTPLSVGHYSTVEAAVPLDAQTIAANDYVMIMRGLISSRKHSEQTDAELITAGKSLCAEIDAGASWQTFMDQVSAIRGDRAFYRAILHSAVAAFCPEHSDILQ